MENTKQISKKLYAVLLAALLSFAVIGSALAITANNNTVNAYAAQSEIGAAANKADGKYTGKAKGFKSTITVEVTVKDRKITDVKVVDHDDTKSFFNKAKDGVVPKILEKQSADVDTVSGATYSSNGIKNAVGDALK